MTDIADRVPPSPPPDPEELEATAGPDFTAEISPGMTLGPVHLTVSNLAQSLRYYEQSIGLEVLERAASGASLGVGGRELVVLVEKAGARPAPRFTGLFHLALLLPERHDLAAWLAHAARDRVALTGLSDHFVSEALYLSDPDGHGIEIYWDRPREHWDGQTHRLTTLPLDVDGLISELEDPDNEPFDGMPAGTVMGHVHLKVADIPQTIEFFRDGLGLGLMASMGDQAAFLAAGGYHHHIGANTWESAGAPPPPPGWAALRHATIVLPDSAERTRVLDRLAARGHEPYDGGGADPFVRDPSGNALALTVA